MAIDLVFHNPPKVLIPLAQKWQGEGRSFYLGPENLFWYGERRVNYRGSKDVSRAIRSWRIHTPDCPQPSYTLTEQDVTDIAGVFAGRLKFETCLNYVGCYCNSQCAMCPYHSPETKKTYWEQFPSRKRVLDLDEMRARMDRIASLGVEKIALESLGDIFAYKHWKEYIAYSVEKGLKAEFNTNGIMLTDDVCRVIAEHDVECVNVSLHAVTPETHQKVTGITKPGAFATAENGILLLHNKYHVNVNAKTIWCAENALEVEHFLEKWRRLGVGTHLMFVINDFSTDTKNHYSMPIGMCEEQYCERFYVMPDGRMTPCSGSMNFMDAENSFGLPEWYIDGDAAQNLLEMRTSFFTNPAWKEVCSRCKMAAPISYFRDGDESEQRTRYFVPYESLNLPLLKRMKNMARGLTPPLLYDGIRSTLRAMKNRSRKIRGKYREF